MIVNRPGAAVLVVLLAAGCADKDAATDDAAAVDTLNTTPPPVAVAPVGMLDPETASRDELIAAGISAADADAIIAARPIDNMLEVDRILGASMDTTARDVVYARVWKPIDLNTASGEEIMLIPNVGERMKHEFEEYRPYADIERFRREIGKYVDSTEVARLEKYVVIRSN
jgi:DNA uptake protein ComE-like DNA-binding protein